MRKLLFALLCLTPIFVLSQKLKVNEYDKFIKQRRVEVEPMSILTNDKSKLSLGFLATGSSLFTSLNGVGWGATTIDKDNEVIFLFSNDSTVTIRSTGLQSYQLSTSGSIYKHQYNITVPDIEALSRYELVGLRKYGFNKDYTDLEVSKQNADKIKKLSALFLNELKKAKVIQTVKFININDINQHIGDSVQFYGRVFTARYYDSSENKPTVLDLNKNYGDKRVNIVIWGDERKNFAVDPEQLYINRDVCISGLVQLNNNIPQIILHDKSQIKVTSPIELKDAKYFIDDSVTLNGSVFSTEYNSNSQSAPTILYLGAGYPDQLCTALIEKKDRKNFIDDPEVLYNKKNLNIKGKITLYYNKPQIVISSKDQINILEDGDTNLAKSENDSAGSNIVFAKEIINSDPQFPGGNSAWIAFLKANLKSPVALSSGQTEIVVARFSVSSSGDISNIEIIKSAGKSFDNTVIKVIKKMPKWTPQIVNGKPINSVVSQRFCFNAIEEGTEDIKAF
ncbi:MAG TPA: energy transducer TonB [Flavisolibacter sp.]|nr:energy transducer TonB [Flavisolibacter sp.]